MRKYFLYTQLNIFKRKSIWISAGLLWLFGLVILIIVPASLKIAPDALWNNGVTDFKVFMVLVNSIVCSIIAVVIFHESKENGTELIIAAKPIARLKIVFVKFLCLFITILIITAVFMIIASFTLLFGTPSPTNSMGVDHSHIANIELGILVGTIVISLFFGAIATLIAMVGGKIAIMVCTIGIAILFNLAATIIPIVATGIDQYIEKKYGVNFDSIRYIGDVGENVQFHNATCVTHVKYNASPDDNWDTLYDDNWDTLYYANAAKKVVTSTAIGSYFNVSSQLSKLYNGMIPLESSIENSTGFGEEFDSHYSLNQENIFNDANTLPWISYHEATTEGVSSLQWRVYGSLSLEELSILALGGETPNSIAYIRNVNTSSILSLVNTRFIDLNSVMYSNRDNDVVKNYVHDLEEEGFGVRISGSWEDTCNYLDDSAGPQPDPTPSNDIYALREVIVKDLMEDTDSLIYMGKSLPIELKNNDDKYNEGMDIDFLAILFLLYKDVQDVYWKSINEAIDHNSLPDIKERGKWTDNGNNSILDKLRIIDNEWSDNSDIKHIQESNALMKRMRLYHFPAFSTDKNDIVMIDGYPHPYSLNDKYLIISDHAVDSSDIFSSLYNFEQHKYVSIASISTFWSLLAVSLFLLSALIYARTDFK